MVDASNLLVSGLALAGGGAVGAVLGVGLGATLKWTDGWLAAIAVSLGVTGAVIGLYFVGGPALPQLPSLAALAPKFGHARDEAEAERVLKTYYPDDYAEGERTVASMKAAGATDLQTQAALGAIATPLLERQLPLASSDNTRELLELTRAEQSTLAAKDPQLCLRVMMQPGPDTTAQLEAALPDDLKTRQEQLGTRILEQTATKPQPPNPAADADSKLKMWAWDAGNTLSFDERDAFKGAVQGGSSDANAAAACKVFGALLSMMSMAELGDGTEVFKALEIKGMQRTGG